MVTCCAVGLTGTNLWWCVVVLRGWWCGIWFTRGMVMELRTWNSWWYTVVLGGEGWYDLWFSHGMVMWSRARVMKWHNMIICLILRYIIIYVPLDPLSVMRSRDHSWNGDVRYNLLLEGDVTLDLLNSEVTWNSWNEVTCDVSNRVMI